MEGAAGGNRAGIPKAGNGRRPYALKTMLRTHPMQNWFGYSDPAMEEALYEVAPLRRFAGLSLTRGSVPHETTILNFRDARTTCCRQSRVDRLVGMKAAQIGFVLPPAHLSHADLDDPKSAFVRHVIEDVPLAPSLFRQ